MKIRNGFVSNSSSSSFIINKNAYNSVFDLATAMINIRNENDWPEQKSPTELERLNIARSKSCNTNHPVVFPTINYSTHICISHETGNYIVSTCNNTEWPLDGIMTHGGGQDYDEFYDKIYILTFWSLKYGLLIKELNYDERRKLQRKKIIANSYCPKHYANYCKLADGSNKIVCPVCARIDNINKDMFLNPILNSKVKPVPLKRGLKLR